MPTAREVVRRTLDTSLDRFRKRGRAGLGWVLRLTAAAVASFIVANLVFPHSVPLLAPLTALLVVQLTPVSLLVSGVQRVISVVAGVSVAVVLSSWVGISWWSLGTVIALALLIGQVLRLGSNLLEVPISAMLILGVNARVAEPAAWQRIAETLVGAGVGVLSNLLFPPKVTSTDAAGAIDAFADDVAHLLDSAADDIVSDEQSHGVFGDRASRWLDESRRLTYDVPNVGSALLRAEESRRLNLRALALPDSGPGLRQGLEALEHSAVTLRSMFRSFVDAGRAYDDQGRDLAEDVRSAVALLLHDIATGVRAFGRLVYADARPGDDLSQLADLRKALDNLRDARARVNDLLLIDPRGDTALAGLTLSLLVTVERLLQELDLDQRSRRVARLPPTLPLRLPTHDRRPDGPTPRRVPRAWSKRRGRGDQA